MLTSPALDPELPAIELQAAHSGAGKGRRFPLPQDKGGPEQQPGAPRHWVSCLLQSGEAGRGMGGSGMGLQEDSSHVQSERDSRGQAHLSGLSNNGDADAG